MKKFSVFFRELELDVYADTREEARRIALKGFISQLKNEMKVIEMQARTERCDICQYTYIPSEIVKRDGEQLCVYCDSDKYPVDELRPEDIPF
jgi:hypothetical protein